MIKVQETTMWRDLPYAWEREIGAGKIAEGMLRVHRSHTQTLRMYGLADTATQGAPLSLKLATATTEDGKVVKSHLGWIPAHRQGIDAVQRSAIDKYREWLPLEMWSRWRQVYVPHPLTTNALFGSGCDKIPGAMLRRLRHPDPMFALPWGVPITHSDGQPGMIRSFVINGAHSAQYGANLRRFGIHNPNPSARYMTSTADKDINAFSVQVFSEVMDGDKVVDVNWGHFTIPILEQFTLDSLVATVCSDFSSQQPLTHLEENVTQTMRTVLSHLLYAVSANVDLTPVQRRAKKAKGSRARHEHPTMHAMGYRLGTALGAWQERQERGLSVPDGSTRAPHLRQAHFHLYRVGRGRTEEKLNWLAPIPVNATADGLGDDAVPVVHRYM